MVESAFNPMAYSRAHASGMWQFIPGTGRRFELEQNSWYDGRRDIVDSTNAALDYLTKLYEMHGDWHLALASYNWGENAVRRAVNRNKAAKKKTDYASLRMPKETRHYIPKLQALENIIADPAAYGVDLDAIPNQPYFAVINDDAGHRRAPRRAPRRDAGRGVHRAQPRLQPAADPLLGAPGASSCRPTRWPRSTTTSTTTTKAARLLAGVPARARREARGHRQALRDHRRRS